LFLRLREKLSADSRRNWRIKPQLKKGRNKCCKSLDREERKMFRRNQRKIKRAEEIKSGRRQKLRGDEKRMSWQ